MMKRVAVVTSIRNDTMFLERWVAYYGAAFGAKSLYVLMDGHDQPLPDPSFGINAISTPYVSRNVVPAEKARARKTSAMAAALLESHDLVIAVDIDEFIVVDPALGVDLATYLSSAHVPSSLSALGLDVAQHLKLESAIDLSRPFLDQRSYAHLSSRYTKPSIISKPVRWGSGQHRIKGRNFRIDPNLFLFHFGSVDFAVTDARTKDKDRIKDGWGAHQQRRNGLFDLITESAAIDGDARFASARRRQSLMRPIYAWNKPGKLRHDAVVRIPDRFRGIV